jgi:hypothetical protein
LSLKIFRGLRKFSNIFEKIEKLFIGLK